MAPIKNVAVFGASGTLGHVLLPALLNSNFSVTAICRPGKPFSYPNVTVKTACYDDLQALTAALENQDAIIEAFNPAAATCQALIMKAAIAARISHVITPDFSSDTFNEYVDELHIFEPKLKAQQELQRAGISWTAIIVGAWYDWAIENGKFWVDRESHRITRFGSGDQKISISRVGVCGEAVVAVLKAPDKYLNRPVYIASHTVSTNELIELVKEIKGNVWNIVDVRLDKFIDNAKELWHHDTEAGVEDRLGSQAYRMLGTAALFNESNRYSANFGDKLEEGWGEGRKALKEDLKRLLS
ncbi:oxidoreductase - protein [Pochonia chlamydosporia 170]|uniref:Oxidoreductase - protein n=1 Tax=Pochonia chlamydosporia 170 TaxID=1380566 RepID=A0A179F8T1_METCM|nr:oxidoreductase - protein [Pochonia chlamydosporia 170]OAQ61836.1 oxidoreductase - protein [Pochonia chlamydosporia 170]